MNEKSDKYKSLSFALRLEIRTTMEWSSLSISLIYSASIDCTSASLASSPSTARRKELSPLWPWRRSSAWRCPMWCPTTYPQSCGRVPMSCWISSCCWSVCWLQTRVAGEELPMELVLLLAWTVSSFCYQCSTQWSMQWEETCGWTRCQPFTEHMHTCTATSHELH